MEWITRNFSPRGAAVENLINYRYIRNENTNVRPAAESRFTPITQMPNLL